MCRDVQWRTRPYPKGARDRGLRWRTSAWHARWRRAYAQTDDRETGTTQQLEPQIDVHVWDDRSPEGCTPRSWRSDADQALDGVYRVRAGGCLHYDGAVVSL